MSDKDKKAEAVKVHAARAAREMKRAAHDAGDAAEVVKDEVVDHAERTKDGFKELGQKMIYSETGRGIIALSLAGVTAVIGVRKLQNASRMRMDQILRESTAKGHIRPGGES